MVKTKSLQAIIAAPLRSSRHKFGEDQPQDISVSMWVLQGQRCHFWGNKRGNLDKGVGQPCLTCGVTPWSQWSLCATRWSKWGLGPKHFSRNGVCPQKQLLASETAMSEECERLNTGMRLECHHGSQPVCLLPAAGEGHMPICSPILVCGVCGVTSKPHTRPACEWGTWKMQKGTGTGKGWQLDKYQDHTSTWGTSERTSACEPRLVHMWPLENSRKQLRFL